MVVQTNATATLEKPPVEPPLPDLPSMDKKIKIGINGKSSEQIPPFRFGEDTSAACCTM